MSNGGREGGGRGGGGSEKGQESWWAQGWGCGPQRRVGYPAVHLPCPSLTCLSIEVRCGRGGWGGGRSTGLPVQQVYPWLVCTILGPGGHLLGCGGANKRGRAPGGGGGGDPSDSNAPPPHN